MACCIDPVLSNEREVKTATVRHTAQQYTPRKIGRFCDEVDLSNKSISLTEALACNVVHDHHDHSPPISQNQNMSWEAARVTAFARLRLKSFRRPLVCLTRPSAPSPMESGRMSRNVPKCHAFSSDVDLTTCHDMS